MCKLIELMNDSARRVTLQTLVSLSTSLDHVMQDSYQALVGALQE